MLKKILMVIGVLLVVILALPAVLPDTIHMERSIVVNQPPETVFALVSDLNQFDKWNPWKAMEPASQTVANGVGIGSTYEWRGQQTGSGKMTIADLSNNQTVKVRLQFMEPMAGEAWSHWHVKPGDGAGQTTVVWSYDGQFSYFERYFSLTMDAMMGPQFEQGLQALKGTLEKGTSQGS